MFFTYAWHKARIVEQTCVREKKKRRKGEWGGSSIDPAMTDQIFVPGQLFFSTYVQLDVP